MIESMVAIDGGRPLLVAALITAFPIALLLPFQFLKFIGLDIDLSEWDSDAVKTARAKLSPSARHQLLLRHATYWGYFWVLGGVLLPVFLWTISDARTRYTMRDVFVELGLANFLAGLMFLAIVAIDRQFNRNISGPMWQVVRRHLPALLYLVTVVLVWMCLFVATLL